MMEKREKDPSTQNADINITSGKYFVDWIG
ncbi:hypothetical protein AVEN_248684-1, partial [Araneus ventricosus]